MKIEGYIVSNGYNGALGLGEANVLRKTTYVTLFPTRRAAKNSIKRTLRYAERNNFDAAPWSGYYIDKVTKP